MLQFVESQSHDLVTKQQQYCQGIPFPGTGLAKKVIGVFP